jgi:hypothetical protein
MRHTTILICLLAACGTTAKHGFTSWGQEKYTLNTAQTCIRGEDAVKLADRVLPEIAAALQKAGYIKRGWTDLVDGNRQWATGRPVMGVCLVPEPEACCIGSACRPPVKDLGGGKPLFARKAGCASDAHAWASLSWPPVCRAEWPDEPKCVETAAETSEAGWESRLFHEVFNMAIQRWSNFQSTGGENYYQEKIYDVEKGVRSQLGL